MIYSAGMKTIRIYIFILMFDQLNWTPDIIFSGSLVILLLNVMMGQKNHCVVQVAGRTLTLVTSLTPVTNDMTLA